MQKTNWLLIGFILIGLNLSLSAQTLNFHEGSIKEAMDKGKAQNKMVFVDFFADWCAPCKVMDREVFTHPEVVNYFNKNFISVKLDAEKGEGINFAARNKVSAYPTFIIFNQDEEPELRLTGAHQAKLFLEKIQKGLDSKRSPEVLAKRYKEGERTPALINDYVFLLMEKGNETEGYEIANKYFNSLSKKKLRDPSNWFLFERYTLDRNDQKAKYLLQNKKQFVKKNGEEKVNKVLNGFVQSEVLSYLSGYRFKENSFNEKEYNSLKNTIAQAQLPDSFAYAHALSIIDARAQKDFDLYLTKVENHFQDLHKFSKFVIMINMSSSLKEASDEVKLRAADFLEKYAGNYTEKVAARTIKETILKFRKEDGYTSVNFEQGDFNSVMKKAKAQDKLIFFDAFADWCGPCKLMDETVFADSVAGRFFNTNFINVKVDMEKGEGPELLKSYPVLAFPTYLLIDKNGKEVHRIVGSYGTKEFMRLVAKGSQPQTGLTYLKETYKQGSREPSLMANLAEGLFNSYQKQEMSKILNEYFDQQTDEGKMDKQNAFMYKFSTGIADKKFQYLIDNSVKIRNQFGEKNFLNIIDKVVEPTLMNEQSNFRKKDFIRTKYPQLYTLNLPKESQTKVLMDLIDVAGEGGDNFDKLISYQSENVLKFNNERTRLMTMYLLLGVPNNGTAEQKVKLQSLLKNVIANSNGASIKDGLELFLKNLEGKMEVQ